MKEKDNKTEFFKTETGCITYFWIKFSEKPAVCVGNINENISKEEAIDRGKKYWEREDKIKKITTELQEKYPGYQIYIGFLPTRDCEFKGEPGQFIYVLKNRCKNGKYQIKEAIKI